MLFKLLKNKLIIKPKLSDKTLIIDKLLGNKIKVEPITNPIIEYNVWEENLLIKKFIIFKKIMHPKNKPNPIGNKTLKLSKETASKYKG